MHLNPTFTNWHLDGVTVFLRVDANVPLLDGHILSDQKLTGIQRTIDALLKKRANIIIATHIGRPNGHASAYSTLPIYHWFINKGYKAIFNPDIWLLKDAVAGMEPGSLCITENMRFNKEETSSDQRFAQFLASCAPYYVFDAFASAHRTDTSIALLGSLYDCAHKSIGYEVERELAGLEHILHPKKPFVLMMGGAKVKDKLPLIDRLLDTLDTRDTLILLPPLVGTFLKAMGIQTGSSLVELELVPKAQALIEKAQKKGIHIYYPLDYVVGNNKDDRVMRTVKKLNAEDYMISIGPETINAWQPIIANAGTIFFNGPMGFWDHPETMLQTKSLLQSIAQSSAFTVIGGGDSIAAVYLYGLEKDINFLSTGGGATLAYLAQAPLPGLETFTFCHP